MENLISFSHGENWGEKGYMKLPRDKDNYCGIASYAMYPVLWAALVCQGRKDIKSTDIEEHHPIQTGQPLLYKKQTTFVSPNSKAASEICGMFGLVSHDHCYSDVLNWLVQLSSVMTCF